MLGWLEDYRDRCVLVTGHTGFKGGWLATWLGRLGARVVGVAQEPGPGRPSFFELTDLGSRLESLIVDVRDLDALRTVVDRARPEVIFHLAAQSLVRRSYREPVETYSTNVMGTVNLLEIARQIPSVRAVVVVTSDKCYENREWIWGYRENEPLGGHDPYSSSKAAAELVTSAYRRSFFRDDSSAAVASARAGNVIGGGDWAEDRLIPDIVRAMEDDLPAEIRNPSAVRPWQHVLDPVAGYLQLGAALSGAGGRRLAGAWNLGPGDEAMVSVEALVGKLAAAWPETSARVSPGGAPGQPHEAGHLRLDASKAREQLGWIPLLGIDDAVDLTVRWYRAYIDGKPDLARLTEAQIASYEQGLEAAAVSRRGNGNP